MIVDTSAIVAVVLGESEADELLGLMAQAPAVRMSSASYLECALVLDHRLGPAGRARFDRLLTRLEIALVEVTTTQAERARAANLRYGKGAGHPAKLNYGDLFAYALAAETGEPLLYVGADFTYTDLTSARI